MLWEAVRTKKTGYKFYRQKPLVFYIGKWRKYFIADFYCRELKLVIELDGKIHEQQKEYDQLRDAVIREMKLSVIRVSNDVIENNLKGFLSQIIPESSFTPSLRDRGEGARGRGL